MKKITIKTITAILLTAAVAASLTACSSGNTYEAKIRTGSTSSAASAQSPDGKDSSGTKQSGSTKQSSANKKTITSEKSEISVIPKEEVKVDRSSKLYQTVLSKGRDYGKKLSTDKATLIITVNDNTLVYTYRNNRQDKLTGDYQNEYKKKASSDKEAILENAKELAKEAGEKNVSVRLVYANSDGNEIYSEKLQ